MKVDVILGLQWGDEGKGKIVDLLTPKYDAISRFQGGPNAGHTIKFGDSKYVLHIIPSGIFHNDKINVIGNGVVIDPLSLIKEVEDLEAQGIDVRKNLFISTKANLIMPTHKTLDLASEMAKGESKIGSTLKGIGPTYIDKIGRNGLRVGDIFNDFKEKFEQRKNEHIQILDRLYGFDFKEMLCQSEHEWTNSIEALKSYNIIDGDLFINNLLNSEKSLLAEGAQGTLLDIDFGSYPYVTSSNTISASACISLGVSPTKIGKVFGVFKSYCTRVGSGPMPTELHDYYGDKIRNAGNEYGSTTGRSRRCGWLDLVALKYAVMINGVTDLFMMKSDVLDDFDTIKVCIGYKIEGEMIDCFPFELDEKCTPVYIEFAGWKTDLTKISCWKELPDAFIAFINFIDYELNVPISVVSVGPEREQTIFRNNYK